MSFGGIFFGAYFIAGGGGGGTADMLLVRGVRLKATCMCIGICAKINIYGIHLAMMQIGDNTNCEHGNSDKVNYTPSAPYNRGV